MAWKFETNNHWTKRIDYPTEFVSAEDEIEAYDEFCKTKFGARSSLRSNGYRIHCTIIEESGDGFWEVIPGNLHDTWRSKSELKNSYVGSK